MCLSAECHEHKLPAAKPHLPRWCLCDPLFSANRRNQAGQKLSTRPVLSPWASGASQQGPTFKPSFQMTCSRNIVIAKKPPELSKPKATQPQPRSHLLVLEAGSMAPWTTGPRCSFCSDYQSLPYRCEVF